LGGSREKERLRDSRKRQTSGASPAEPGVPQSKWKGDWKVVPDNFALKIQGDGLSIDQVGRVLDVLRAPVFWQDETTRRQLLAKIPDYRLSKFQRVLPERWQVEMVGAYLLDFDRTARFLAHGRGATEPARAEERPSGA
jgi:hypothetical protein